MSMTVEMIEERLEELKQEVLETLDNIDEHWANKVENNKYRELINDILRRLKNEDRLPKIQQHLNFMDEYICEKLCLNHKTKECPFSKENPKYKNRKYIKIKELHKWRRACNKFLCKQIGISPSEQGGIGCHHKCGLWFICNMSNKRFDEAYAQYLKNKGELL